MIAGPDPSKELQLFAHCRKLESNSAFFDFFEVQGTQICLRHLHFKSPSASTKLFTRSPDNRMIACLVLSCTLSDLQAGAAATYLFYSTNGWWEHVETLNHHRFPAVFVGSDWLSC